MKVEGYTTGIDVVSSPEHVFNCLTDVSKWWGGEDFAGESSNLNDEFTIIHGDVHYSRQKLTEVIPDEKLVWLVTESRLNWLENPYEWAGTRMIFRIAGNNGSTAIQFTHEGLAPEKQCYSRCIDGWDMVIKERLFNYISCGSLSTSESSWF